MLAVAATVVLFMAFAWMPADGASYRRLRRDTLRVSSCTVSGEPHYNTFDGQLINYQGICKHLLVSQTTNYTGSNAFQIYLRNEHRESNNRISFLKDVLIDLCGDHVEILRCPTMRGPVPVTVQVNNATVKLPYSGNCYSIDFNGNFVYLETTYGLKVRFNGLWLVNIQIPDNYVGVTHGMCGNNNEDADDDLTTADGTFVGSQPNPGTTIGNSYVVVDGSNLDQSACLITPPENSTTCTDVDKQRRIAGRCSVITDDNGVFGRCINRVGLIDAQLFYSSCLYDACHFNESSICLSLEVFALECFLHGVQVTWRNATGCQLQCPTGMIPSDDTCACQQTCDNPLASRSCRWPNTAMCVCPEGQILSNGQCVTCCGCVDSLGIPHESGSQWTTTNCETFECTRVSSTSPFDVCTSNITIVTTSCPNGANCQNGECITTPTTTATTETTTTPTTTTAAVTTPTNTTGTTTTPTNTTAEFTTLTSTTPTTTTETTTTPTTTTAAVTTPTTTTGATTTPTTTTADITTLTSITPTATNETITTPTTTTAAVTTPTTTTGTTTTPTNTTAEFTTLTSTTPTTTTETTTTPTTTTAAVTTPTTTTGATTTPTTTTADITTLTSITPTATNETITTPTTTTAAVTTPTTTTGATTTPTTATADITTLTSITPTATNETITTPTTTTAAVTTPTTTTGTTTTPTNTTAEFTTLTSITPTTTTETTTTPTTTTAAVTTPTTTTETFTTPTTTTAEITTQTTTTPSTTTGTTTTPTTTTAEITTPTTTTGTTTTPTTTTETTTTAEVTTLTSTTPLTAPDSTPTATTMIIRLPTPGNLGLCPIFDAQAACSQCNFTVNPAGYVANPCNCTSFYQCVNFNGIWNAYQRPCPPCLCWDPVTLVCSNVANSTVPLTDPSCSPVTITTESPDANCAMFSPASDPRFYIVKGLNQVMPCPSGTLFDSVTCRCLVDNRANSTISSRIFCLDFDNSNLLNGVFVSQINLNVGEYGFRGKSAYFNGNSAAIEVPALTNVQLSEFTVSLWFRRVGTNTGSQGLVDSSDCRQNGSIHVISADQSQVTANLLTTGGYVTIDPQSAAYDAWSHVALLYDGSNVRMYVNNVLVSTVPSTGQTLPASCPILFGHYYTSDSPGLTDGWFNGYMDNICFYRTALTTSQINNLYNSITV